MLKPCRFCGKEYDSTHEHTCYCSLMCRTKYEREVELSAQRSRRQRYLEIMNLIKPARDPANSFYWLDLGSHIDKNRIIKTCSNCGRIITGNLRYRNICYACRPKHARI